MTSARRTILLSNSPSVDSSHPEFPQQRVPPSPLSMNLTRSFLPLALSLGILGAVSHGQTIESVLTALQKRKQAILIRDVIGKEVLKENEEKVSGKEPDYGEILFEESKLIQWPGGIARF